MLCIISWMVGTVACYNYFIDLREENVKCTLLLRVGHHATHRQPKKKTYSFLCLVFLGNSCTVFLCLIGIFCIFYRLYCLPPCETFSKRQDRNLLDDKYILAFQVVVPSTLLQREVDKKYFARKASKNSPYILCAHDSMQPISRDVKAVGLASVCAEVHHTFFVLFGKFCSLVWGNK